MATNYSSSSFLLLLFLSILLPLLCQCGPDPLNDDVLGLIVFKADVSDPHSRLASWNEDSEHACNWKGVSCNDPSSTRVTGLSLSGFELSGKLSRGLLLLKYLKSLDLSGNNLSGEVQPELLKLGNLETVDLSSNGLSGAIPDSFFEQCRSVRFVSLANNRLTGNLPGNIPSCLSLSSLNVSGNQITGFLPSGIWSLIGLRSLDLSNNDLSGPLSFGMNQSFDLRVLNLRGNRFSGEFPTEIGDFPLIKSLDLSDNLINGTLPDSMRKLSNCHYLGLRSNYLNGLIPSWIGEIRNLEILDLSWNKFSGEIPNSISNLQFLKEIRLSGNTLNGNLPAWISNSNPNLQLVFISDNLLNGSLQFPGNSNPVIRFLDLSGNSFSDKIPDEISTFKTLQVLNLSRNFFSGLIPAKISDLKLLEILDLSSNKLNHVIPSEIFKASSLKTLDLSENNFTGPIPPSISNLTKIQRINLSQNKLTGEIPSQLSNLHFLTSFNISHNQLTGQLPSGRFFSSLPLSSLSDNPSLCGSVLNKSCSTIMPKPIVLNPNSSTSNNPLSKSDESKTNLHHKKIILSISTLVAIGGAVIIAIGVLTITVLNFRVRAKVLKPGMDYDLSDEYLTQSPGSDTNSGKLVMIGGGDLQFSAGGHALLNKDCELGRGGFGTVYKTVLRDGRPVAIKKLTVSSLVKSREDFEREVRLIGKARHRNLVGLKGYYWTSSLQLLIYEFIPGGNLYRCLHEGSSSDSLSWLERFDIILGVARSLAYLHRFGIIHYNIKSCNVLLDGSGEPKLTDYGLAKLLPMLDRYVLSSKIQSALGYMAPEFACKTVKITEKCDIFGFGVLILEVITGRKPVEYLEDDVVVLCDLVRVCLEEGRVEECVDERLGGEFSLDEILSVVKLGLVCTSQVPSNRPDMCEVVKILEVIKSPQSSPQDIDIDDDELV